MGGGEQKGAHVAAYEIVNGKTPPGKCVLHRCDRPLCVNPAHLFLGTHNDNSQDMVTKGRSLKGTSNRSAKLDDEKVRAMKGLHYRADWDFARIGRLYGVTRRNARFAITGRSWKHVRWP